MHGVPQDLDLSFLLGLELFQICFGRHDMGLNFDRETSIMVLSQLSIGASDADLMRVSQFGEVYPDLFELIGSAICAVERLEGGKTLSLQFTNGRILQLHDDSSYYESFVIYRGQQIIAV